MTPERFEAPGLAQMAAWNAHGIPMARGGEAARLVA